MIIPNLRVTDLPRSVAFYRDVLGLELALAVTAQRAMLPAGEVEGAVFATLEWNGAQLMLQTAASLAEQLDCFQATDMPSASGTVYFRGIDPRGVRERASAEQVVKGPELQWYGMLELYLRDPDGYILCVGAPEGPPPGA